MQAYRKLLTTHLTHELRRVALAWLNATTGRVPVWSGMAKASLMNVAAEVGGSIVIQPRAKSRVSQGIPMGTVTPKYGPDDFTIEISTGVPHYVLQEYTNVGVSKSAPWKSFEVGASAYRAAVQTVRLPQPVLKPIKIKVT